MSSSAALLSAERPSSGSLDTYFFFLGTASDIAFQSLVMSVAYLREELGNGALGVLAPAHCGGSLAAMTFCFLYGVHSPGAMSRSTTKQTTLLPVYLSYMFGLLAVMLWCSVFQWHLDVHMFQGAVLVNGIATGLLQSFGARLAGSMGKSGVSVTAVSAKMSGVGFGVASPTVIQLLLMASVLPANRSAAITYFFAVFGVACGIVATINIRRSDGLIVCSEFNNKIADVVTEHMGKWTVARFKQVRFGMTGMFLCFAATVYCALLTVHVPPRGLVPSPAHLPTLLIGTANVFDFLGRFSALRLLRQGSVGVLQGLVRSRSFFVCALLLRLMVAAVCTLYTLPDFATWHPDSNAVVIGLYALGAFIGGSVTVALTQDAQTLCMRTSGLNMDSFSPLPCPLAAQLLYIACMAGSFAGTMFPLP